MKKILNSNSFIEFGIINFIVLTSKNMHQQKIIKLLFFICIALLIFKNTNAQIGDKGHISVGLLDFECLDTANLTKQGCAYMEGRFYKKLETEVYFNSEKYVECRESYFDSSIKTILNFKDKTIESYVKSRRGNYYTIDKSLSKEKLKKYIQSDEGSEIISISEEEGKEIHGVFCYKVEIKIEGDRPSTILYTTKRIPYYSRFFEIEDPSMMDYSFETKFVVDKSFNITYGVKEITSDFDESVFTEDITNYKYVKPKKFDKITAGL